MEVFFTFLASAAGKYIAGAVAIVATLAGVWLKGRSSGKASERAKQAKRDNAALEEQLEMHREADAVELEVGKLSNEQLDKEIAKWSRPNGGRSRSR